MSLTDVEEGVVLSSRRQSSQMTNVTPSPPRINVISPSGGSPSPTTPSPSRRRDRNDSASSTTTILASARSTGKDSGETTPLRSTQRVVEDHLRRESLYDTPTTSGNDNGGGGGGGGNRRGSFLNIDSARRRLSNVGDAVSRKISGTIGWKTSNVDTVVQEGVLLCKHYVRKRLKRSGLLTRKIGLRRTTSAKLVVESSDTETAGAASTGNGQTPIYLTVPELAALGAELEKMYPELYERVGRQIGCVQFTSKQRVGDALGDVVRELMQRPGGCNWSKIVAIYAVAGGLACDCVRQGNPDFLDAIYEAMENLIEEYLAPWILIRGGWTDLSAKCRTEPHWDPEKSTYAIMIGSMIVCVTLAIFVLVLIVRLFFL
ncbi:hypothetical protein TKK_0003964 [Trichogramma kaykai]